LLWGCCRLCRIIKIQGFHQEAHGKLWIFWKFKNIFKEDFLNFEKTFDSWREYDGNILRLSYDSIGTEPSFRQLEKFLEVDIARLQKHKRRSYVVGENEIRQINKTYESLIQKVDALNKESLK